MIYSFYNMECDRLKLVVLGHFFSFSLLKTKKKKKSKKWKKIAGDIIILDMCTKNHNHMMYGYWDTEWDRQIFSVILGLFLFFHPLLILKIKFWKNERNVLTYYPFTHMYHINEDYMAPAKKDNFLSFLVIFFTFTPLTIHKIRILKKWEIHLEILSFYLSVP